MTESPKCRCWKPSGPPQADCPVHGSAAQRRSGVESREVKLPKPRPA